MDWITFKKFILLPFVLFYAGTMTVGAWPDPFVPEFLEDFQEDTREFIKSFRLRANADVFRGTDPDAKRKTLNLLVFGEKEDGTFAKLYSSFEGPRAPLVRVREKTIDTMLKRMMGTDNQHALREPKKHESTLAKMRKSNRFDRISAFFGYAPHFENEDIKNVFMVWDYEAEKYSDGGIYTFLHVVHGFDLKKTEKIRSDFPIIQKDPDGSISLLAR